VTPSPLSLLFERAEVAFFNNELSSILQYFTFPIEVTGFTLATIEISFPRVADQITNRVAHWRDLMGTNIRHSWKGHRQDGCADNLVLQQAPHDSVH